MDIAKIIIEIDPLRNFLKPSPGLIKRMVVSIHHTSYYEVQADLQCDFDDF